MFSGHISPGEAKLVRFDQYEALLYQTKEGVGFVRIVIVKDQPEEAIPSATFVTTAVFDHVPAIYELRILVEEAQ